MKYILILLIGFVLVGCNAISLGKKCTYSADGTKVWSYVWLHKDGKPADIQKINFN